VDYAWSLRAGVLVTIRNHRRRKGLRAEASTFALRRDHTGPIASKPLFQNEIRRYRATKGRQIRECLCASGRDKSASIDNPAKVMETVGETSFDRLSQGCTWSVDSLQRLGDACPPQDVGGARGYAEFLTTIVDDNQEEHDRYLA
jgi:hypothetical protein